GCSSLLQYLHLWVICSQGFLVHPCGQYQPCFHHREMFLPLLQGNLVLLPRLKTTCADLQNMQINCICPTALWVILIMNRVWHVQKNKINLYFLYLKDMHAPTARKWRMVCGEISVL